MTPRRSARSNKKQTRLTFNPLPSSSPSKPQYSAAVQDRLANVRYDTGMKHEPTDEPPILPQLPTPDPSSQLAVDADNESEDDDVIVPSSKKRRITTADTQSTPTRKSGRFNSSATHQRTLRSNSTEPPNRLNVSSTTNEQHGEFSNLGSPETTDEEGDIMISQPARRRKSSVRNDDRHSPTSREGWKSYDRVDDFLANDDEVEYETSDEEPITPRKRRQSRASRRSAEEQEELEADLEDLQDSGVEDSARKSRTRGGPVTKQREQRKEHLDLLKRRRAGERIPRVRDSDDEDESAEGAEISLIGRRDTEPSDNESVHSSVDTEPEPEEEVEDDFIENDTSGGIDRPHLNGIPVQFTYLARAKPREVFPHVVEWLVKNKIAPAFARHDEVYTLAFNKVNDQVQGQAGSRLISAAWNATFKWTILARPHMSIQSLPEPAILPGLNDEPDRHCDACNRTNHPARYDFVLSGEPYVPETLEPVDDSDDEDEDENNVSRDAKGHELARQTQHFYLGSNCAANAQMGHKLSHWKHHLNESILSYLEEQGVLSAEAIVAREKLNNKKREKEAEAIVDTMEDIGKIRELWREFQDDLDDARLGMEDYVRKGRRSKGRIGVVRKVVDGRVMEWRDDKDKEFNDTGYHPRFN